MRCKSDDKLCKFLKLQLNVNLLYYFVINWDKSCVKKLIYLPQLRGAHSSFREVVFFILDILSFAEPFGKLVSLVLDNLEFSATKSTSGFSLLKIFLNDRR